MFYERLPRNGVVRRTGRVVLRALRSQRANGVAIPGIDRLNLWQEGFCEWNAQRLRIPYSSAVARYRRSWNAFQGGHAGEEFRRFCLQQENAFSVLADDTPQEVHDAYRMHGWLFLLRQVAQPVPVWDDRDPLLEALSEDVSPVIVDFGCGLAQAAISLSLALRERGVEPELLLADLPTVRLEFVTWLCRRHGLDSVTAVCTPEVPVPDLPRARLVIANEVFEHLHDPLGIFGKLDAALDSGGFLLTNVADHEPEFMHVSPDLGALRERIARRRYVELRPNVLFRKS